MIIDIMNQKKCRFVPVCSYGRSGSSLLMSMIRYGGVNVFGDPPFEDRTVQSAFLCSLRFAFEPEPAFRKEPGMRWTEQFDGVRYESTLLNEPRSKEEIEKIFSEFVDGLSKSGRFAVSEKSIGVEVVNFMRSGPGTHCVSPIFLVRDPRDIFCSIKSFNAKRGYKDFADFGDDQSLFSAICRFQVGLFRQSGFGDSILIRYEDLINARDETFVRLFHHLRMPGSSQAFFDAVAPNACANSDFAKSHMTSENPASSINRWKSTDERRYWSLFDAYSSELSGIGYLV